MAGWVYYLIGSPDGEFSKKVSVNFPNAPISTSAHNWQKSSKLYQSFFTGLQDTKP